MTEQKHHVHYFTYFLAQGEKGVLSAQVRELPGIFAQGKTHQEIEQILPRMAKQYLERFGDIHEKIINNISSRVLTQSNFGEQVTIGSFVCKC